MTTGRPARRVYSVDPSRQIARPVIARRGPRASRAPPRGDVPDDRAAVAPVVTALRPSAAERRRGDRPPWRPDAAAAAPVSRSTNRTEPSSPPASSVWSSGPRPPRAAPTGSARRASVRASSIALRLAARSATTRRRPSRVGIRLTTPARRLTTARAPAAGRWRRRSAGSRVPGSGARRPTAGEQRAPVRREAQRVTNRSAGSRRPASRRWRARVEHDRRVAADREPCAVGAVGDVVEADRSRSMQSTRRDDRRADRLPRPRVDERTAVLVEERQRAAVGAEVEADHPVAVAAAARRRGRAR